jgi:phosphoribosyl-ATP pyrophosphohydrolase/phosphoribosyl-AMP cyclohydrolase
MGDDEAQVKGVDDIRYDEKGLVPAIVQEQATGRVLMLAYMNMESLTRTLETGRTWFYSRSRQELWPKGETSGHIQKVKSVLYDCDADAVLVQVEQVGVACHTGELSCFYRELMPENEG